MLNWSLFLNNYIVCIWKVSSHGLPNRGFSWVKSLEEGLRQRRQLIYHSSGEASQSLQGSFKFRRKGHRDLKTSTVIDYVQLLLKEDFTTFIQSPNHLPALFYSHSWFWRAASPELLHATPLFCSPLAKYHAPCHILSSFVPQGLCTSNLLLPKRLFMALRESVCMVHSEGLSLLILSHSRHPIILSSHPVTFLHRRFPSVSPF